MKIVNEFHLLMATLSGQSKQLHVDLKIFEEACMFSILIKLTGTKKWTIGFNTRACMQLKPPCFNSQRKFCFTTIKPFACMHVS